MTRDRPPGAPAGTDDEAIDALFGEIVAAAPPPLSDFDARKLELRVVASMEATRAAAIRRTARRTQWCRGLALAAAAALAVVLGLRAHAPRSATPSSAVATVEGLTGSAEIVGLTGSRALAMAALPLGPDDELRTGQGTARASLPTGSVVHVGPASRVRFLPMGDARALRDRIELAFGAIDVSVPKLPQGSELRVQTQDATVVVHGTRFSVEQTNGETAGRGVTRVAVREGRVAVYSGGVERWLGPGDVWTGGAPEAPMPETVPSAAVASSLAAENGLLADAMAQRHAHDPARAVAVLDDLLRRYPASPLAETAAVERLHALEELGDRRRLVREAQSYLAAYPRGFGRGEATRMVEEAKARP